MNEVEQQVWEWCSIARYAADTSLIHKYKLTALDRAVRGASDIATAQNLTVFNSTQSILQHCRRWSDKAIKEYYRAYEVLTHERGGKPPTHRQTTQFRENGKRPWIVEHPYPIKIIKDNIIAGYSTQQIYDWIWEYGTSVILLREEDPKMTTCKTVEEAHSRYDHIKILDHPHFSEHKEAGQ